MNAKKLIACGMSALMLTGCIPHTAVSALANTNQKETAVSDDATDNISDNILDNISMQTQFYSLDDPGLSAGALSIKNAQTAKSSYNLAESAWAGSGSDYYFSLLNTNEKKLYLTLKKQADCYLTGTDPFQTTEVARNGENVKVYILPLVSYEGLTTDQMKKVFYCFMFENPQYYFLRNSVIYSETTNRMTVGLYELFADGNSRAEYTRQFAQQLEIWDQQIQELPTAAEKEQFIHRFVCEYVAYDDDMAVDDPDDREMSQSCISAVLFDHSTVCAGYAQMFALLCSRADLTCVTVTSAGHAWNKIRMGGNWYNVDCTWNDCRGDETFLNVTDEQLLTADTEKQEHVLSAEWEGVAPSCTAVFDPEHANGEDTVRNVSAPEKMSDIAVSNDAQGSLLVSFAPLEGCDGYTVQYASNGAMLSANKTDTESNSYVITELKSGKDYYVRVRAYVLDSNGEKLYGPFSGKVKAAVR